MSHEQRKQVEAHEDQDKPKIADVADKGASAGSAMLSAESKKIDYSTPKMQDYVARLGRLEEKGKFVEWRGNMVEMGNKEMTFTFDPSRTGGLKVQLVEIMKPETEAENNFRSNKYYIDDVLVHANGHQLKEQKGLVRQLRKAMGEENPLRSLWETSREVVIELTHKDQEAQQETYIPKDQPRLISEFQSRMAS